MDKLIENGGSGLDGETDHGAEVMEAMIRRPQLTRSFRTQEAFCSGYSVLRMLPLRYVIGRGQLLMGNGVAPFRGWLMARPSINLDGSDFFSFAILRGWRMLDLDLDLDLDLEQ